MAFAIVISVAFAGQATCQTCDWIRLAETGGTGIRQANGNPGEIYDMAVFDGDLYVTGIFVDAGGDEDVNSIARWDGSAWNSVGTGLTELGAAGKGYDLEVVGGLLYVAGEFADAGGVASPNIATWNGSNWQAVNGGLSGSVQVLEVYRPDSTTTLLVAGSSFFFTDDNDDLWCFAYFEPGAENAWTYAIGGTTPSILNSSGEINPSLHDLLAWDMDSDGDDDFLYLGGNFGSFFYEPLVEPVWAFNVAKVDLSGQDIIPMDCGVVIVDEGDDCHQDDRRGGYVTSLETFGGKLFVGGYFSIAGNGGDEVSNLESIVRWNETNDVYEAMAGGGVEDGNQHGTISTLKRISLSLTTSALFVGGFFDEAGSQGTGYSNVARIDLSFGGGFAWSSETFDGGVDDPGVYAFIGYTGIMHAAGKFEKVDCDTVNDFNSIGEWDN